MVHIEIKTKIPTINDIYGYNRRIDRRYLKPKGKEFKQLIFFTVMSALQKNGAKVFPLYSKRQVRMDIHLYFKRRGRDRNNPVKLIEDALEGVVYKNDKQLQGGDVSKFPSNEEKIVLIIY